MNCENCKISVDKEPLIRINELGEKGIFWCELCIKKEEPELYKNLKEDQSDLEKELKNIFY